MVCYRRCQGWLGLESKLGLGLALDLGEGGREAWMFVMIGDAKLRVKVRVRDRVRVRVLVFRVTGALGSDFVRCRRCQGFLVSC